MKAMNIPLISVVIPAYNCENCINNAIESVLEQTYNNYELIVVDDGSTDNTFQILKTYGNCLKYLYQKNGGVSKARNTGIKHSNGDYIAFLDADDVWIKNKLDIQMMCFKEYHDVDMIFSSFRHVKNQNIVSNMQYEKTFNVFKEFKYCISDFFERNSIVNYNGERIEFYWGNIYNYLFLGNFILPSSVLIKKESLYRVGLLNEKYRVAEETEFFLRFSRNNNIGYIKHPLLYYELPESDNLSGKKNTERLIKNALKIQIDSVLEYQHFSERNDKIYKKGISMTYSRLAYYYLTEFRLIESRRYSLFSMWSYYLNIKAYVIFLATFFPEKILQYLANKKKENKP